MEGDLNKTERLINLAQEHSENGLMLIVWLLFQDLTDEQQEEFFTRFSRKNIDDLEKKLNEITNDHEITGDVCGGYCRWPRKELAKVLQFRSSKSQDVE